MKAIHERPEVIEARGILRLVSLGASTVESARELIEIPEREKAVLDAFANLGGEEGITIGSAVRFRAKVLKEFDRLVASGLEGYSPEQLS